MGRKVHRVFSAALFVCVGLSLFPQSAKASATHITTTITVAADVSGSVNTNDPNGFWRNAVSLAIDLAPAGTQASVMAISDDVVADTGLLDTGDYQSRALLREALPSIERYGNTNLGLGIEAAVEQAAAGAGEDKHVVFIADINEGGFALTGGLDLEQEAARIDAAAAAAAASDVHVHLLFYGPVSNNESVMQKWASLAEATGGSMFFAGSPSELPAEVESLYFSLFQYTYITASSVNTTGVEQNITLDIPSTALHRARIYVSAATPVDGFQAKSASGLDYTHTSSYSMVELLEPSAETVSLALVHGDYAKVNIYLILDTQAGILPVVNSFEERVVPENPEEPILFVQRTEFSIEAQELVLEQSLLPDTLPESVSWTLSMTTPDGERRSLPRATYENGVFVFTYYPDQFGEYQFELVLEEQGVELARAVGVVNLEAITLSEPIYPSAPNYPLIISLCAGALILAAAIAFAIRRKRMEPKVSRASLPPTLSKDNPVFTGKLDIYGTTVDSGKVEVPPVSIKLKRFGSQKKVSLADAMRLAGSIYHYPDAEQIWLLPGSGNTLIISNQSDAHFLMMSKRVTKGHQVKIAYGQKVYVVFEEDANEYEIYFHHAVETAVDDNPGFSMDLMAN